MSDPTAASGLRSIRAILEAAAFAAEMHSAQKRKGVAAEPYVNHLLEVAHLVSTALAEPDADVVIAALLHDAIEDAGVSRAQITQRFGSGVAALVSEVTDDKSLPKAERKRLQVVNAPRKSVRAQLIKLADKISNLRAIRNSPPADWSPERQRKYVEWANAVVNGLTQPSPVLKAEFDALYRELAGRDASGGHAT
jgi:GTP diphosphokinase / guanosine-3',5'-bis(diphosphate) 3'-diphosphatase